MSTLNPGRGPDEPSSLLARIKRRKLFQWAVAYAGGAWLVLQLLDLLAQPFAWPDLVMRAAVVLLGIGFVAALVLAWFHGEKGEQRVGGVELLMLGCLLVIAGVAVAWVRGTGQPVASRTGEPPVSPVAETASTIPAAAQSSIAVLPFVNMSSDPEQEFFSDGLTEELLNVLAQLPELRVASRTSSFSFKGKDVAIDSIARSLRVAHVLEGSVRKAGDRVRITAQLIDTRSGFHLWSETYDRSLKDVFAVQDEISKAVAAQLRLKLVPGEQLAKQETTSPEAHTLVLRGSAAQRQFTRESLAEAERLFRQALELDPRYAQAHARLSNTLMWRAYRRHIPLEAGYANARAAAERALALDPKQTVAHTVLGNIASRRDWNLAAAEAHFRRALEINPGNALTRNALSILLMRLGQPEQALREALRAVELDPVSAGVYNNLGLVYFQAGQLQRAVEMFEAALALSPDAVSSIGNLAITYSIMGRHADAVRTAERGRVLDPKDAVTLTSLGYVYGRAGKRAKAERALEALRAQPDASPYLIAAIYAGLGDKERAFTMLEMAVEKRDDRVLDVGVISLFYDLRGDPRMQRLLQKIRLN